MERTLQKQGLYFLRSTSSPPFLFPPEVVGGAAGVAKW